jgi:hypothetical protein
LNRLRLGAALALAVLGALAAASPLAFASAEIHKMNVVLSAMPTSINGGDFNDQIDQYNRIHLTSRGLEGVGKVQFGWLFDTELHYFVRPNVAATVGVGQIHAQQKREFLPAISQDIQIRAEVLSVPIHAGADYYFTPYNQGDFQARVYMGGGMIAAVGNKALVEQVESRTDSSTTLGGSFVHAAVRDSPGYYVEAGVHFWFASKLSVMLGGTYRSIVVRQMLDRDTYQPVYAPNGKPFTLDVGGIGARMAIGIGL